MFSPHSQGWIKKLATFSKKTFLCKDFEKMGTFLFINDVENYLDLLEVKKAKIKKKTFPLINEVEDYVLLK